jgi:predicted dehydrogenase
LCGLPSATQVVAIDDRREIREAMEAEFPGVVGRPSLIKSLDEIDAVVIATPPESHFDIAAEALAAGKHVLVEKPMTTNSLDGRRLVEMADRAGLTLAAGHTFAHNAAVRTLADIARRGVLGPIHYLDSARLNLGLYRDDVNVLWDLAAHDISIANLILHDVPDVVSAWGSRHTDRYSEDVASLRMQYLRRRVEATVRASWLDPVKVRRTTVVGANKMAVYNDVAADERIKIYDRGRNVAGGELRDRGRTLTYRQGDIVAPHIEFPEPLRRQAQDFIESCRTGRRPVADGLAGLAVVAVLEASDQSIREDGAPVHIDHRVVEMISATAA